MQRKNLGVLTRSQVFRRSSHFNPSTLPSEWPTGAQQTQQRFPAVLHPVHCALVPMPISHAYSESHVQKKTTAGQLLLIASHTARIPPPSVQRLSEAASISSSIASATIDGRWCVPVPPARSRAVLLSSAQPTKPQQPPTQQSCHVSSRYSETLQ